LLCPDLIDIVKSVPLIRESSLTSNCTLLADQASALKDADLRSVNISLDDLNLEIFKKISTIRIYLVLFPIDIFLCSVPDTHYGYIPDCTIRKTHVWSTVRVAVPQVKHAIPEHSYGI